MSGPAAGPGPGAAQDILRPRFTHQAAFGSDGERLGAALHLRAAVLAEGLGRGTGEAVVRGEEPLQHLFVAEAVVPQERRGPGEALDDLLLDPVDEGGGDVQCAVL